MPVLGARPAKLAPGANAGPLAPKRSIDHAPSPSSAAAARIMRNTARRDTAPELAVRRAVHARGLRYFVDRRPDPLTRRRADLLFPRLRLAVFVDGCFWHCCPQHGRIPKANSAYWSRKFAEIADRDADVVRELAALGWKVLRVWEHDCPEPAASAIAEAVVRAKESRTASRGPATAARRARP